MAIAHERQRQILQILIKKTRFSPIVSIQGPRQCGKSYLARNILPKRIPKLTYHSLDQQNVRTFASENPRSFLTQDGSLPMAIDEVQKVPDLFDEMKDIVDRQRKPGQFVILGSTEFSHETQVRESLTGRLSRVRLYPFNLSETLRMDLNPSKEVPFLSRKSRASRSDLLRYLKNGGLPGIFSVKSDVERQNLFSDWISLTVERDLHQIQRFKLDSEVARSVLSGIAKLEEPTAANLVKQTKLNPRKLNSYLLALKTLFVIFEVLPFQLSTGKPRYYLTDVGLLHLWNASFERQLQTWFYLEMYSQLSYKGHPIRPLHFYRSSKGNGVDLMFEQNGQLIAVKLIPSEKHDERDFFIFYSLQEKYKDKFSLKMHALSGTASPYQANGCSVWPWESLV
jgi:predicted AAA+ superfamily ATPase